MVRLVLSFLLLSFALPCFSQTAGANSALKLYQQKEERMQMTRKERRTARRNERLERKARKKEDRRNSRYLKKSPYNTTKCTYDWRDY